MEEIPGRDVETEKKGRFHVQNKMFILTYGSREHPIHVPKEELIEHLIKITGKSFSFIRCAHETGTEKTPYLHTHVVMEAESPIQTNNARFFDYRPKIWDELPNVRKEEVLHPHIRTLRSKTHLENAKRYIAKEDPENKDLKEKTNIVTLIQSANTLNEAFSMIKRPGDAAGAKILFQNREMKIDFEEQEEDYIPEFPWQLKFLKMTSEKPDDRTILWYWDKEGGMGKSKLGKMLHMNEKYKKGWYTCVDLHSGRDGATVIRNAIDQGWTQHGFILDLARSRGIPNGIYATLEDIKNGFITATKYEGTSIKFKTPHVCVFSNSLPEMNVFSKDRLKIRFIYNRDDPRKGRSTLWKTEGDKDKWEDE